MSITASTLAASRSVQPIAALDDAAIAAHLAALPDWKIDGGKLARSFAFGNYTRPWPSSTRSRGSSTPKTTTRN